MRLWGNPLLGGFYLQCLLGVALVYWLAQLDARAAAPRLRALGREAGDLAYPIFLLHSPVAIFVTACAFRGVRPPGWWLFAAVFPVVRLAAWLLHRGVEVPVAVLRRRVREE